MDPLLSKEELSMREKIRGHEFPFDEKAWGAMKTMLDEKSDKPVAGIPLVRNEPVPGPARRWIPLLLLCMAFGLGAAALLWRQPQTLLASIAEPGAARQINTTTPTAATPAPALAGSFSGTNTGRKSARPMQGLAKQQAFVSTPEPRAAEIPAPPPTVMDKTPLLDTQNLPTPLPAALPCPTLLKTPKADSLLRPDQDIARRSRRLEHGILAGLNAHAASAKSFGLGVMPHAGYFLSYPVASRTSLQVEAIARYVAGYRIGSSQQAVSPSGNLTDPVRALNFDMFFLEFPVLIKHHTGSGHAWFAGLKPGLGMPRFEANENTTADDFETQEQSARTGIQRFDIGVTLGWEWQFARRWALDLRYNQGLKDLSDNRYFLDNIRHRNSGLQVSVKTRWGG
ncbi:MAG: PorT family protein [Saprospiraceae bacterium]|nr:PorT family protein [Saprospiraceae bacterium]